MGILDVVKSAREEKMAATSSEVYDIYVRKIASVIKGFQGYILTSIVTRGNIMETLNDSMRESWIFGYPFC
jgi:hypothetical protein